MLCPFMRMSALLCPLYEDVCSMLCPLYEYVCSMLCPLYEDVCSSASNAQLIHGTIRLGSQPAGLLVKQIIMGRGGTPRQRHEKLPGK